MTNPKRKHFKEAVNKLDQSKFGKENVLSPDLAERIGSLADKSKITIRLDVRVIEEAKKESEELGVGYQKIINDRLLEIYALEEVHYLKKQKKESDKIMQKLLRRIEKLELKIG